MPAILLKSIEPIKKYITGGFVAFVPRYVKFNDPIHSTHCDQKLIIITEKWFMSHYSVYQE